MTSAEVLHYRLYTQHIAGKKLAKPEDVVQLLGAVQSQDYPGAAWSLAQRVQHCTRADIDDAFNAGRILRTHVLRPTWHFVLPQDIRWMLELTGPRVQMIMATYYRKLDIDEAVFKKVRAVCEESLRDNNYLTRKELGALFVKAGIAIDGLRLSFLVGYAELEAIICSGPFKGKQHTYALLAERAPQATSLPREQALAELVYRYFKSHGPVTDKEFVRWSGLTKRDTLIGMALVVDKLGKFIVNGETYWHGGVLDGSPAQEALLLPEYDECVNAYIHNHFTVYPGASSRTPDMFYRPIIIGELWVGTWRRRVVGKEIVLDTNLFIELSAKQKQLLHDVAQRYASYAGMPVRIQPWHK